MRVSLVHSWQSDGSILLSQSAPVVAGQRGIEPVTACGWVTLSFSSTAVVVFCWFLVFVSRFYSLFFVSLVGFAHG